MSECQETNDLLGTARDTVVLILELGDREIQNSPRRILEALQSDSLARAIRDALEAEGRRLAEAQRGGQPITNADGEQVLTRVGTAAATAGRDQIVSQIQSSSRYQEAERQLRRLSDSFRCSPMGVFIDENSTWLYLVASGLALGGAVAMYSLRSGDTVAGWATDFAARQIRSIRIGRLEVGAESLRFVPSQRIVEVRPFTTVSLWQNVRMTYRANIIFQDDVLQTIGGGAEIVVPVGRGQVDARASAGGTRQVVDGMPVGSLQPNFDLRLGITIAGTQAAPNLRVRNEFFLRQQEGTRSIGASSSLQMGLGRGASANLGVSGSYSQPVSGSGRGQPDVRIQAGLSWEFE